MHAQHGRRGRDWRWTALVGATGFLLIACSTPSRLPPTPTAAPVVIATAVPTALPTPTQPAPTPIAPPTAQAAALPVQPLTVYVTGTGGQGLTLRQTPGGAPMGGLPDGTALTTSGEEQSVDNRLWRKVRDSRGREGWVAVEFLTAEAPTESSPSPIAAASPTVQLQTATPTWPVPLIPTATLRPPPPTRTPRESPAPILAPTAPPVIVPGIVATNPAPGPGSRP